MDSNNKEPIRDEEQIIHSVEDVNSAGDSDLRINALSEIDRRAMERYSKGVFACPKYDDMFDLKDDINLK
jgi:hypothetical protein